MSSVETRLSGGVSHHCHRSFVCAGIPWRVVFLVGIAMLCAPFFSGCARYPTGVLSSAPALLITSVQVAGNINPSYYYFIALQASQNSAGVQDSNYLDANLALGPFAVFQVDPNTGSWGNGWGTGKITDYVEYHNGQAEQYSVNCAVLANCPAAVAAGGFPVGPPFSVSVPSPGLLVVSIALDTLGLNGAVINGPPTTTTTTGVGSVNPTPTSPTYPTPGGVVVDVITTDSVGSIQGVTSKPVDSLDLNNDLTQLNLSQSKTININTPGPVLHPNPSDTTNDLLITAVQLQVQLP
jgi:hypothetical protein